eukprot:TRINITY_DN11157_c0_g2_i1.p1 TRINITY_DN11157_c0_g2~~TRINITY_DN11157_c0_g2_i1.p1  ORF type:complete len:543 (+),score=51.84 TRINITY_DN11157_c0_g2_i1:111-1739(+)
MVVFGFSHAVSEAASPPVSLHILGRPRMQENSDICGEYRLAGVRHGRAIYKKPFSGTAIYYHADMGRWIIDRNGVCDSDICVAFAEDTAGSGYIYPANPELVWSIWDSAAQTHVIDMKVVALVAPATIALLGRREGRENDVVSGGYVLVGAHHGKPAYQQRGGSDAIIKYNAHECRWLLGASTDVGNVCSAFAEDPANTRHPGCPKLEWNFWEPSQNLFVVDTQVRAVAAPQILHVLGGPPEAERSWIYGTYFLVGIYEEHPLYVLPGTRTLIRHSSRHDWWLIDSEGLAEKSLMENLDQWILACDSDSGMERCSCYAEARGTTHPGSASLEWHVLDTRRLRHVVDPWVRATTAPLALRVQGRQSSRENSAVCGDYTLIGTHMGRAAWQKPGTQCVIRYYSPHTRWVIDWHGLRNSDECVAFAEDALDPEHPAGAGPWKFFETERGLHDEDSRVSVIVPTDAPIVLPALAAESHASSLHAQSNHGDALEKVREQRPRSTVRTVVQGFSISSVLDSPCEISATDQTCICPKQKFRLNASMQQA